MFHLQLTLFGNFGARLDGEPVNGFESNKVRALLAYLAVESSQSHTRTALAGLLWPEYPEQQARQTLSQAVYNLRHILGEPQNTVPFLLTTRQTLQFNPHSAHWLDTTAFSDALHVNGHESLQTLAQAVALYTAPFLNEFALKDSPAFEEWALLTRERLHRQALHALQSLASLHEPRGELPEALQYARRAVELDPLWEAAHRQVIHLLALSGQRTQALAQYESLRLTLFTELGVEPEHETQKLASRLQTSPLTETAPPPKHNLPAFLTPFIGREDERVDLAARLRDPDCRLLTVLGPGGSGKTRCAVEAAREALDAFPDGAWFVSLAAVTAREGMMPALVQSLGIYLLENIPPEKQLQDYLREKCLLLVLDNYEQLLPEVSWLVDTLRAAPRVRLLVTSRMALNLKGEHLYPLAGLSFPKAGETLAGTRYSAIRLFADAAERAWASFRLTSENLPAIVDICRTVAGMPLGIILAAAWVGTYREDEILAEIHRDLDFLATAWADVPERQRSLRATFAYSWRLLTDEERGVMRALSVFQGGFTREAAREICGATPHMLLSLSRMFLVQSANTGRFHLHELIKQYLEEQFNDSPETERNIRNKHSIYYLKKVEQWAEQIKGSSQKAVLQAMDIEIPNIQTSWNWALTIGDWEGLACAIEGLGFFLSLRIRVEEGLYLFDSAQKEIPDLPNYYADKALLLGWQGWFHYLKGEISTSTQMWESGIQRVDDLSCQSRKEIQAKAFLYFLLGYAHYYLKLSSYFHPEETEAKIFLEKSVKYFSQVDDSYWLGQAKRNLDKLKFGAGYDWILPT